MTNEKSVNIQPEFIIIAGPNGAGKTTTANIYLPRHQDYYYINADNIAKGLSPYGTGIIAPDISAGKIAIQQIKSFIKSKELFVLESALSGKSHARFIKEAQLNGFKVTILYIYLHDVNLAISRVKYRVKNGGHSIPENTIHRRYIQSLFNLQHTYLNLADQIIVVDNSVHDSIKYEHELIYQKDINGEAIHNIDTWKDILKG